MAANGERVNISELEDDDKGKPVTKKAAQKEKAASTNGTPGATNLEQTQTQTVVDAEPTNYPSLPAQSAPANVAPAISAGAPSVGSAMPQALLGAGMCIITRGYFHCSSPANGLNSARRRNEESDDELVLCRLLYRLTRGPTKGVCQHAGGRMKPCRHVIINRRFAHALVAKTSAEWLL